MPQNRSIQYLNREPGAKGYSTWNLWRMKRFYETYCHEQELLPLIRQITWTNNLFILSKCKTSEEREFYLKLTLHEKYGSRELERQIDSGYFERLMLSGGKAPSGLEGHIQKYNLPRDSYMLEFLNLPTPYKEYDLQEAIIENMKNFLLEFGSDFIFVGKEYKVQVGNNDYYIDLLFYHRGLQCLVAFELKIDDFKPEYLGKMNFYLEALDRDVKKPNENPSVGIILCKSRNKDVVEYSLSKNISQAMVSEYQTKLIDKEILRKKLNEIYESAEVEQDIDENEEEL